jgi:hypothetical protein
MQGERLVRAFGLAALLAATDVAAQALDDGHPGREGLDILAEGFEEPAP